MAYFCIKSIASHVPPVVKELSLCFCLLVPAVLWKHRSYNIPMESNIYSVLLAEVLHHHGWEVFCFRLYIIGTQELSIGLQPAAEGVPAYARCAGQFGFGV